MSQATLTQRPYVNSNLFSGHYLDERVQERDEWNCDDEARQAMDKLQTLYELEGTLVEGYGEDALIDNWIDEVLDVLGFGTQDEVTLPGGGGFVDELLFETPTARRDAAKVYLDTDDTTDLFERGVGIVEAKQWDAAFNIQFSEQRPYRNASHQTKHYLENTPPNTQWGILTNGRKWRLYGTNDYETQTYYEVDLPELLERRDLEAFKYFYVFFRPTAFHESGGTTFLDEVWSESETASQELGENLQDNVFTALRVLGRGFVKTNDDLNIDPDDEEALDELKEQSLVFLYRLMFVLYAEARGLIHPEGQRAQDDYEENFSLDALRLDIHEEIGEVDEGFADEFSNHSTGMWSRLEDLFQLIDEGEEDLGIPPYNGGLFDHEEHDFLTDHDVSNRYLAEVIYRLSTTQNDEGRYMLADYADLDTRHLGSVYEGLLEHQFRIAPEQYVAVAEDGGQVWRPATEVTVADAVETVPEGGLYVVNDEGERKATGAYYTPDYVVTYIVEETVGPLVEEIREDLIDQGFEPGTQEYIGPFFRRVTDLRILDPAMGSGHFLTNATGYLSEQVMSEVREAEKEFGVAFDEQHIRREIAKECIYGVDLNGMAVELAKLSMWLETLAADRPLAFLDHHFKQGNSLVGSDIESIEELESDASDDEDDQYSLAEFGATREGTIERLMDIYSEFLELENETVEDVQAMKRKYAEIEQDELRRRLVAMANVHTAERFGADVPSGAYERMAKALEDNNYWEDVEKTDWFSSAQSINEEKDTFHWKLEFPETFYDEDGSEKSNSGFDAIIGNPPYFNLETTKGTPFNDYLKQHYSDIYAGKADILYFFCQKGLELLASTGHLSFILSRYFTEAYHAKDFRESITKKSNIDRITDFGNNQVFPGVDTLTVVMGLRLKQSSDETLVVQIDDSINSDASEIASALNQVSNTGEIIKGTTYSIPNNSFGRERWLILPKKYREIKSKVTEVGHELGSFCRTGQGMMTGLNEAFTVTQEEIEQYDIEDDVLKPLVKNGDLRPYLYKGNNKKAIYLENKNINSYPNTKEYLEQYRTDLEDRAKAGSIRWYRYQNPINKELFEEYDRKLICPFIATDNRFYIDNIKLYNDGGDIELIVTNDSVLITYDYLAALLNSTLLEFYHLNHAKLKRDGFYEYFGNSLRDLPIAVDQEDDKLAEVNQSLRDCAQEIAILKQKRSGINTELLDYIEPYSDGPPLTEIGIYQPPDGVGDTKLTATKEDYEKLRVGTVACERAGANTIIIHVTARYKPEDEDAYETDQYGYTETETMPAMELTGLSETEADLVEAFVPVAVEEADGFAGFRENATKTNSLVDRLEAITLPDPDDVADDLERYREAVERAEELDEKTQRTDDLIDEIVYDLYGLTDEEIEIVEEAVADD